MIKNLLSFIGLFFLFTLNVSGQVSFPTPNAAEFAKYGQIPVQLFNGLPEITVPIYTVKNKDIEVPIALSYHATGIRTEQHPTWVGLGWNLSCGGSITRVINGLKDELDKGDLIKQTGTQFTNPWFGNFYASQNLSGSDWASLNTYTKFFPQFKEDFRGYLDPQPDEFIINAPGISASFYFYRDEQDALRVKIKSKDGKQIKVEPFFSPNLKVNFYGPRSMEQTLTNPFFKFIITSEDGKKYVFGGNQNAIDFFSIFRNYLDLVPTTWYLTEISSSPNVKINFNYKRMGNPLILSDVERKVFVYDDKGNGGCSGGCGIYDNYSLNIQHPVYLSSVTGSNGVDIQFRTGDSFESPYDTNSGLFSDFSKRADLLEVGKSDNIAMSNFWIILDEININNKLKINFSYINNQDERLKLKSINFNDGDKITPYSFFYNETKLPPYNSKKADNWGFYNGKSYSGVAPESMYTYRSSDAELMKAETLTSIRYPTGGTTNFDYERHDYSKIATQFPSFDVEFSSGIAGGLRISKITSTDGTSTNPPLIREFTYLNVDNTSSGILSGIPIYHSTGRSHVQYDVSTWIGLSHFRESADYKQKFMLRSESYLNMLSNTNGNHITYSRVIETIQGGGKVIRKYTNHDDYPDLESENMYTNYDGLTLTDQFTSRQLERGLLISQETYDVNNNPVQYINNEYNSSPSRYNDFVKSISRSILGGLGPVSFTRMTAYKIFTFYPYLEKQTVETFGTNKQSATTVVQDFKYYFPENLLWKNVLWNSKGEATTIEYKYPGNMRTADPTGIYNEMYNDHFYSPVIQKTTSFPNGDYELIGTSYYKPFTGLYVPKSIYRGQSDSVVDTISRFYNYDDAGNVLSLSQLNGPRESVVWDYNKEYPVLRVDNADFQDVAYTSFESNGQGGWDFYNYEGGKVAHPNSPIGKNSYLLSGINTISKSGLKVAKTYNLSYWSNGEGPNINIVNLSNQSTPNTLSQGATVNGWTYYLHTFSGTDNITLTGSNYLDELILFPAGAQPTTYSYEPFVGMTGQMDAKGKRTLYEYDKSGRLQNVKDHKGNIVKNYSYNFKLSEDVPLYKNQIKSREFRKNNCGSSGVGSFVTYVVEEGRYTSRIGIDDANNQALADIELNGQIYANQRGICICDGDGPAKKMIDGRCETGRRVNTSSVKVGSNYRCTYHYEWSDGSMSKDYSETSTRNCPVI